MVTEKSMKKQIDFIVGRVVQRGFYLTFGDACVNFAVCKAIVRHQMCPERLAAKHKTSVPLVLCPRSSGA